MISLCLVAIAAARPHSSSDWPNLGSLRYPPLLLPVYPGQGQYPADVNPALCPYYPYCHLPLQPVPAPYHPHPVYTRPPNQYPADVDPASCPNYPYCHE